MHSFSSRSRRLVLACLFLLVSSLFPCTAWGQEPPAVQDESHQVAGISNENPSASELGGVGLSVTWKTRIGSGYSGMAAADGKVVTMYAEGTSDLAAAFDGGTGKSLWTYTIDKIYKGHDGSHDGPISTPLIAGGRVFGLHPWGKLFAVDFATGKELWSTHLKEDHGIEKPYYGFGSSPILEDGILVVEMGGEGAALGGFDPATGELRWRAGSDAVAYQSPVATILGSQRQVVAAGSKKVFGVAAKSGEILWEYSHDGGGGRGAESIVPVPAGENRVFLAHENDNSLMLEVNFEQGAFVVHPLWESRAIRNSFNVPVYHEGHLYAYSSRFLTCVDAKTGESRWRSRTPGDGFLILVDGRLVIVTKKGSVHVVEATPVGYSEVVGRPVFEELAWTHPLLAGDSIYVRSLGEIARLDLGAGVMIDEVKVASRGLADSLFGRFLAKVDGAGSEEKKAIVDQFLDAQKAFPITEGENRVHFVYRGPAGDVALAGDMFGARQEQPMTRVAGTDLFYISLDLEADARLNYLFMVDYQGTRDARNPRQVVSSLLGPEMEIAFGRGNLEMSWFSMPQWRAPAHLVEAPEESRGRLVSHDVPSQVIDGEIAIEVYLPRGYDELTEERYPVAYFHDGPIALELGGLVNSLDNLVGRSVTPIIAVFLNIPAQDQGYGRAMISEVIPFVDKTYRTEASAEGRANIGMAFPAFQALALTLNAKDHFSKVGLQSLFMFTGMEELLQPWLESLGENPPRIYMDWGKYDMRNPHEAWDMAATNRKLANNLRQRGVEIAGGEVHDGSDWSSWRNRTGQLLEALFPLQE